MKGDLLARIEEFDRAQTEATMDARRESAITAPKRTCPLPHTHDQKQEHENHNKTDSDDDGDDLLAGAAQLGVEFPRAYERIEFFSSDEEGDD